MASQVIGERIKCLLVGIGLLRPISPIHTHDWCYSKRPDKSGSRWRVRACKCGDEEIETSEGFVPLNEFIESIKPKHLVDGEPLPF